MRNVAQVGRRELVAHQRFVSGVTASVPAYKEADSVSAKEFLVDVYLGQLPQTDINIVRNVPIAKYARNLVTDIRQPVLLERSKQGRYTVIGRAESLHAGTQTPEGTILEPTYHRIELNLAELQLGFIADVDYELEMWGHFPWGGPPARPWQAVEVLDAFGRTVVGGALAPEDEIALLDPEPVKETLTQHTLITLKTWGPGGDPNALAWGTDPWGASAARVVQLES